jgi:hypothetical protein
MSQLNDKELSQLLPAESASYPSPIPTQVVSSDEFYPIPQTARQREVEARLNALADRIAPKLNQTRRQFFATAAGMAAAFVAMNEVYGPLYGVDPAEAATPELANLRAQALADQFVMDVHTHFLQPGTRIRTFVNQRAAVGKAGWWCSVRVKLSRDGVSITAVVSLTFAVNLASEWR